MRYIVELDPGCWLADWEGDPGRTVVRKSAKKFPTKIAAALALLEARHFKEFPNAVIVPVGIRKFLKVPCLQQRESGGNLRRKLLS